MMYERTYDNYIPDLTERYPEGLDGVDTLEPYDPEYAMWDALEKEYYENERRAEHGKV